MSHERRTQFLLWALVAVVAIDAAARLAAPFTAQSNGSIVHIALPSGFAPVPLRNSATALVSGNVRAAFCASNTDCYVITQ